MGQNFWRLIVTIAFGLLFIFTTSLLTAQETATDKKLKEATKENVNTEVVLCPSCYCSPHYDCYKKGFLSLQRGEFKLSIGARLQIQLSPYVGDDALLQDGDPAENPGFRLRRARLYLSGAFINDVQFSLETEFAKGAMFDTPILEAWIGYTRFEFIEFYAGLTKIPFSRYQLTSAFEQTLPERPLGVEGMSPPRQLGFLISGKVWEKRIQYALGIYNSLKRASTFYEGYEPLGGHIGNRLSNFSYVARLEFHPLGEVPSGLSDLTRGPFRFAIGGGYLFNDSKTIRTHLMSADLILKVMGLSVAFEFLYDINQPSKTPNTTTTISSKQKRMDMAGQVSYVLPWFPMEFVVGVEYLDTNRETKDEGDEILISGGLNYYIIRELLKVQVAYTHRMERYGQKLSNDIVLSQIQLAF